MDRRTAVHPVICAGMLEQSRSVASCREYDVDKALSDCLKALKRDPAHEKTLFRMERARRRARLNEAAAGPHSVTELENQA